MRTTIRLPDQLLAKAKQHAAAGGITLNDLVVDAVRAALAGKTGRVSESARAWPTFRGNGVQPGVDLECNAALDDLMDVDGE
ncbi:MAG: YlcI/YnfO family protein [Gemmatimonadota bacterium]